MLSSSRPNLKKNLRLNDTFRDHFAYKFEAKNLQPTCCTRRVWLDAEGVWLRRRGVGGGLTDGEGRALYCYMKKDLTSISDSGGQI